jgi:3-phosphoshikimate 1-carboxyvinyltransferase
MAKIASVARVQPPARLRGTVGLPGDKSLSHRAAIFNTLASGQAVVTNFAPGQDCRSTVRCLKALGAKITLSSTDVLTVKGSAGSFREPSDILDAGNSGSTIRMLAGLLAAQPFMSIITGDASLRARPMRRVIEPLRRMGADMHGREDDTLAPLVIRGTRLHGIDYRLPVPSAQVKCAVILAALYARGQSVIEEPALSRDHTEHMLGTMGASLKSEGTQVTVEPLDGPLAPLSFQVPGDISSAAFWLVAGAIHPHARVTVTGCGLNPTRTGIIDALRQMGAVITVANERTEGGEPVGDVMSESSALKGIEIGGALIPRLIDEIPAMAVAACVAGGTTVIRDAAELRVKESDRIASAARELNRMGADVEERPDGMIIRGGRQLKGTEVSSHGDHRLAMSLAIAGLAATGETIIADAEAVAISYPAFWRELERLSI